MKVLDIRNLMVFYENALALNNLSLQVHRGEIAAVFGSNSAGKTTLMNTVSGLELEMKKKEERRGGERITVLGVLNFDGEDISNTKPSYRVKRGIVLSRERHPVFRDSDVLENLKIAGYLRKRQEINKAIELVFSVFPPLSNLKRRKGGLLSGGEQQMLAIGMALVVGPKLLLMDEPLLGLSPALQADLASSMKGLRREGITIMVAEQFARPLFPIIDRGYVMENGLLILSGTGQELMNNPEVKSAYFGV